MRCPGAVHVAYRPASIGKLPKVDPIASWIGTRLCVLDLATDERLTNDLGKLPDAIVLVVCADVEGLVPDELDWATRPRLRPPDVPNVHEGAATASRRS